MPEPTALPVALARLVQHTDVDIRAELAQLLESGLRQITIGLGPGVDIPLLDQELHAAEIATLDRELVVATVLAESDGYVIQRGWSNFGLYVSTELEPLWASVPFMGTVRGLRPGDKVALGSAPAEALKFELPESTAVPPRVHRRSARLEQAEAQRRQAAAPPPPPSPVTPVPAGPRDPWAAARERRTPTGATPRAVNLRTSVPAFLRRPKAQRPDADRYQDRLDVALKHWRYAMVTFGGDERAVVPLDDPDLAPLRAALVRNLDQPERGYDLFVRDPAPELWVQPAGEGVKMLDKGAVVRLRGPGNRIGFAGYVLHLPTPAAPVQRFGPRDPPTPQDIASVLGIAEQALDDADTVKSAYRDLARRFHPDRHDGEPGHVSRVLEIQACFDAWRRRET
jgi:hypothetical protein